MKTPPRSDMCNSGSPFVDADELGKAKKMILLFHCPW
jgi:hypothetical protein